MHTIVLLAQQSEDLKREAGLRGEDFATAILFLSIVFALGIGAVAFVVLRSRRRDR